MLDLLSFKTSRTPDMEFFGKKDRAGLHAAEAEEIASSEFRACRLIGTINRFKPRQDYLDPGNFTDQINHKIGAIHVSPLDRDRDQNHFEGPFSLQQMHSFQEVNLKSHNYPELPEAPH